MGQAKVRRAALREEMLRRGAEWEFPPSLWEAEICAELKEREQEIVLVPRASQDQLASMRMPANQCHANVRWYVENDPTGKASAVSGWWVQWPNFVLHSIIRTEGKLVCITPSMFGEREIPFLPDSKIQWIEDGQFFSAVRNGQKIGSGVRVYPAFTMAQTQIVRERLLAGVNPLLAGDFSDEELEELKRKHVPSDGDAKDE